MNALLCGTWIFSSLIYNGTPLPLPNPDLAMTLQFSKSVSTLSYHRKNELGFCERKAHYQYDGTFLHQKIFWVHPENNAACTQDPDMQLGATSTTLLKVDTGQLRLHLSMGEEVLIYVWSKQEIGSACQSIETF